MAGGQAMMRKSAFKEKDERRKALAKDGRLKKAGDKTCNCLD